MDVRPEDACSYLSLCFLTVILVMWLQMHRLYGKYLRSESFRKALIYQKRYLLMLLGGFRECEETTLAIIAQMGVYPSQEDVQRRSRHSKAFATFRTAARVIVAIHR